MLMGGVALVGAPSMEAADGLIFTPVARCRVIDTRLAGGPLLAGEAREFDVTGALEGQGGASNCQVPFVPAAVAVIQLQPVEATGDGHLKAWPTGGSVPPGPMVEFSPGMPGVQTAERLVPLCDSSQAACARDLVVEANGADTHLVADVTGYFSPDTPYPAGEGLIVGAGDLVRVDTAVVQGRIQPCPPGSWIRAIAPGGAVTCEVDDVRTYEPGFGITRDQFSTPANGTWHRFSVNTDQVQRRLPDCPGGFQVDAVSGTIVCAPWIRAAKHQYPVPCGQKREVSFPGPDYSSTPAVFLAPQGLAGTAAPPNSYCVVDDVDRDSFAYCCYGHMPEYVNWIAIGPN
jgi:hypothetical protein